MAIPVSYSQNNTIFEIEFEEDTNGLNVPISVNLDNITLPSDTSMVLTEIKDDKRVPVPFQIEKKQERILNWIIRPNRSGQKKYSFELIEGIHKRSEEIKAKTNKGILTIQSGNKNLLSYNFTTVYPPEGIDTAYKRSGFIHPLWSPHGQVLTRIQPPDHYHHYGLWNPWTHVLLEGDTLDFWNLAKQQGTVRFADFISVTNGPAFSEYKALHEHVVFKNDGGEKIALNEIQSVRIYKPEEDYYFVDITSELKCATESPVLLLEYRYGGLGWRATEQWDKNNSEVLTSENKTRKDADGSRARWCIVQGKVDNYYAGIVLMSHPDNYNHPEPLRIWPESQDERGDVFVNISPTKNKDWLLEPGKKYVLKYRLLLFNNHLSQKAAESAWWYFANPPGVKIYNDKN
jgi:hypothetical protein